MNYVQGFHWPEDLGQFDIEAGEVMYYLYLPVKRPGGALWTIPDPRLNFIKPLLAAARNSDPRQWWHSHVYVTVKKSFVGGGVTANRPGWHCDGYLSDDLNFLWYDADPTIFSVPPAFLLEADHVGSLATLESRDAHLMDFHRTYPCKHLLKLDDRVIHKVDTRETKQHMRTFVKITTSVNRFNLKDNSVNPLLPDDGPFFERALVRNDPHQAQRDHYQK